MPEPKKSLSLFSSDGDTAKRRGYFLINMLYVAFWLTVIVLVVRYLFAWMIPFLLGFAVAALLQKPLKWLVRKTKISKKFFSVAMVVLVILLLGGLVFLIGWRLGVWIVGMFSKGNIQAAQDWLTSLMQQIQTELGRFSSSLPQAATASINNAIGAASEKLIALLTDLLSGTATAVVSLTTRLPSLLVSFIMWILASIFLTIDFDAVTCFFKRQIPTQHKPLLKAVRDYCNTALFGLGKAYLLLMLITFAELSVGLLILGVPYAIPLAALIAVIDILPVLGTGTVLIPWSVIALILGNFRIFIGIGLLYVVITIIRNILEPKIVSGQIGLHPLVTLFFMLLGLRAMGVLGMFLFPITIIILKQLNDKGFVRLWK